MAALSRTTAALLMPAHTLLMPACTLLMPAPVLSKTATGPSEPPLDGAGPRPALEAATQTPRTAPAPRRRYQDRNVPRVSRRRAITRQTLFSSA
jgi:hypothetical protein